MSSVGDSSNKEERGEPSFVMQAINNILVKIRGRILLKRGRMMRIKKLNQRIHSMLQLGQLQGARKINEALNGLIQDTWADSELLKSKMSPHEDQGLINIIKAIDWADYKGP